MASSVLRMTAMGPEHKPTFQVGEVITAEKMNRIGIRLDDLAKIINPPNPIINCQNCAQPTLFDRACRYCGGPPK